MDICFIDYNAEIIIHCNNPKGAGWVARYLTTNVAPLHCEREFGLKALRDMFDDGLKISRLLGDGKRTAIRGRSWLS